MLWISQFSLLFIINVSFCVAFVPLRKHAYTVISFQQQKMTIFRYLDIFLIFAQNTKCFRAKRKTNVYPCTPKFSYMKVGCKGLFHRGSTDDLLLLQISSCVVWQTRDFHSVTQHVVSVESCLCFFIVLKHDLFVYRDDSWTS